MATARIPNNVPTIQTIDQIIGTISDQFSAQQLRIQCKIQEQVQTTNVRFAALTKQMQQLISTTTEQPADTYTTAGDLMVSWRGAA
uniref:Uncharacterized protein n=1 Tax=Romanomermis culicivorax TaxID=13658 RepID=A0A915J390_ROMCU